jgi:hypothetical protein
MLKLQFVIEAVDKSTAGLRAINKRIDETVDKLTLPARKIRASVNSLLAESGIEKVGAAWDGLRNKIASLPMVAAVSLGGAFAGLHSTVERMAHLQDLALQLNIPVQTLKQLGYAASLSGSSLDEMSQALVFLNSNMAKATTGDKEALLWFERQGLSLASSSPWAMRAATFSARSSR